MPPFCLINLNSFRIVRKFIPAGIDSYLFHALHLRNSESKRMEHHQSENIDQEEKISLMKQAGKDAIRAILTEDARVQSLPIVQKAGLVSDLIISFCEYLGDSEVEFQYKRILLNAGFEICNKLVVAETSIYFNDKLENALLLKMAIKKVLHQLSGMQVLGISDFEYSRLIENEIEEFRLLFNNWVRTFDKGTNLSDGWELPLNS